MTSINEPARWLDDVAFLLSPTDAFIMCCSSVSRGISLRPLVPLTRMMMRRSAGKDEINYLHTMQNVPCHEASVRLSAPFHVFILARKSLNTSAVRLQS